jgi:hypothetical protein
MIRGLVVHREGFQQILFPVILPCRTVIDMSHLLFAEAEWGRLPNTG